MRERTSGLRGATPSAVRASRTVGWPRDLIRSLGVAGAGGVFLALVGAFGTNAAPLTTRLIYWTPSLLAGAAIGHALEQAFERRGWLEARPWTRVAVLSVVVSVLLTGLVSTYTWSVFGAGAGFPNPLDFFFPVLVVSAVMVSVSALADRTPAVTHEAARGAEPARFLSRLPSRLRGCDLYAVEAEDHYLRLHTSGGTDLILMRLSDALVELEGLEGAQTHRSWWVARSAVEGASRGDGRAVLRLKNGAEAPVSRTFARALREQGWF